MRVHWLVGAATALTMIVFANAYAEQPPPPCHSNPNAAEDRLTVANRGDIAKLPDPLKDRLVQMADRGHTYLPLQVFAEANKQSQLFQYYLLDTEGFEPNVFTKIFPGINDAVQLTATAANCGLSGSRAETGAAHAASSESVYRRLYGHFAFVRHQ